MAWNVSTASSSGGYLGGFRCKGRWVSSGAWFGKDLPIADVTDSREIALLRILIATGDKAIEAFQASDNIKDVELLADLERVIQRSRDELDVLVARQP